jgi:signal transduction histidine kinase
VIGRLRSFYARISTIFLLLVLALGGGIVVIAFNAAGSLFGDVEQLLNRDYARSIARELAPAVSEGFDDKRVMAAIHSMMILNPRVEIYILDAAGKILGYFLNPHETVYRRTVDLRPVLAFIESGGMRLSEGEDPRSATRSKRFSAAPLDMGGEKGFVYIILGGAQYDSSLRMIRSSYYLRAGVVAFSLAMAVTLVVGLTLFFLLTRRLRSLGDAVRGFEQGDLGRRVDARGADELGALGRAFNEMAGTIAADVEKLRQAERMRTELIGNISHDLRSPLASVQGYLETVLLKDGELAPDERRRFLEISLRNTESLRRLVEELFDLVKLETRQVQPRRESFSLAELVQDVVLKLAPLTEKAGLAVAIDAEDDVPHVHGDIGMIERVLTNLIENAVRSTPPGGSLTIGLRREQEAVSVSVADTGSGIDPEDLPRIFERFYRADPSRDRSTGGAGLGLAIARQIVELHGSALEVESRPGEGARFRFRLPVTDSSSARDTSVTSPQ